MSGMHRGRKAEHMACNASTEDKAHYTRVENMFA